MTRGESPLLQFLRAFGARGDKARYVLKGGCNLRSFHRSIRYSEDLDLDVGALPVVTRRNNVDRVLESPSFMQKLRAHQIEIARVSRPTQAEKTQRWMLGLRIDTAGPLRESAGEGAGASIG